MVHCVSKEKSKKYLQLARPIETRLGNHKLGMSERHLTHALILYGTCGMSPESNDGITVGSSLFAGLRTYPYIQNSDIAIPALPSDERIFSGVYTSVDDGECQIRRE